MTWKDELYSEYHHLFIEIPYEKEIGWIECHDGFKEPIKRFLHSLDRIQKTLDRIQKANGKKNKKIQISQIKQKYGLVRANVSYPKKIACEIKHYIGRLEGECYMTCAYCGQAHTNGCERIEERRWVYCICNDCKANLAAILASRDKEYFASLKDKL